MAVRLRQTLTVSALDAEQSSIEAALLAEKASALGRAGRQVEQALEALAVAPTEVRDRMVRHAAERVWAFLVQRELCGFNDRERVIEDYRIPRAVLNRLGVRGGDG